MLKSTLILLKILGIPADQFVFFHGVVAQMLAHQCYSFFGIPLKHCIQNSPVGTDGLDLFYGLIGKMPHPVEMDGDIAHEAVDMGHIGRDEQLLVNSLSSSISLSGARFSR